MHRSVALLLVALLLVCRPGAVVGQAPPARPVALPEIRLETASGSGATATLLEQVPRARLEAAARFVGLVEAGTPLRVVVVPEDHPVARQTLPQIAGFALAHQDLAVLFPGRVRTYPYADSLVVLYLHELTHLFLARASGGTRTPRWFDEGVALVASRDWAFGDRSRVLASGLVALPESTAELDGRFRSGRAELAYALAGELVRRLVEEHGVDSVAAISAGMAGGEAFDAAFAGATGEPLADFEARFWRTQRLWTRWIPFLTSATTLWLAITGLAIVAGIRRRRRDAEIRRRWAVEEWEAEAPSQTPSETETPSETVH